MKSKITLIMLLKYLKYILLHKWYVMIDCFRQGYYIQGLLHDIYKFHPVEFWPYVKHFYDKSESNEFNIAWLHHIHNSPHHFEYWIMQGKINESKTKCIEIPEKYIIELIADWKSAQRCKTGNNNVWEWYLQCKKQIHLHCRTKMRIEKELRNNDRNNKKINK